MSEQKLMNELKRMTFEQVYNGLTLDTQGKTVEEIMKMNIDEKGKLLNKQLRPYGWTIKKIQKEFLKRDIHWL